MKKKFDFGVQSYEFDKWSEFIDKINSILDYRQYIWRGQGDSSWIIESTLDRSLRLKGKIGDIKLIDAHLKRFKYAARGRRGSNPPGLENDNDWWALGQHNGLLTPLLDWTKSPFVSAFFAFASSEKSSTNRRLITGISRGSIESKSKEIIKAHTSSSPPSIIDFFEPLSDENARLVNQGGLFTRSPAGMDIESWVRNNFGKDEKKVKMYKMLLPDDEREMILKSLNRMNINYSSLFPDLFGASKFVNMDMEITNY
ncbi:MAG: FRG domain-containing protein [Bacteroidales bacterium]|nr:FRG domain-containing protein [Bacteroidales bacterium]